MEIKFIIYIIGGIVYFLFKRAQEAKKNEPVAPVNEPAPTVEQKTTPSRPIKPPTGNPFDDARREQQRRQAAVEAQKKLSAPATQTLLTSPRMDAGKELFIHEKRKATFGQGADDAPVYEDNQAASSKTNRGSIRLENDGIYRTETMEEARALADVSENSTFEFDAKQAFIGSVIFERKY